MLLGLLILVLENILIKNRIKLGESFIICNF